MVKKISKETAINKLKELNYIIVNENEYLEDEKATTNYRTNIKCLVHNCVWISTIGEAYRNAKICNLCRSEQSKTWEEYANSKNYKIINKNGRDVTLQCESEHKPWHTQTNNIKSTNCKECSGVKISLQTVLNKLEKLKFELLNIDEFKTTKTIGKFICSRGHVWECQIHNVYASKSECPECSTNIGESKCKFILETIFNKKFHKTRKIIDNGLELDMYNEELNLGLEYQGAQHYIEHSKYFHKYGGFEEQQERDKYKLKFCLDNNINLIIVPYTVKGNELIGFIYNKLLELNYSIIDSLDIDWDTKFTKYTMESDNKNDIFNKMKQYAIDNEGICLETHYLGYETKHLFECKKKHKFKFDGREFVRRQTNKSFCVYCDGKKVDYEYIVNILNDVNMKAISTEYVDCGKTPFTIACNVCNTEFTSVWDNLKQRQIKNGCNNCKKINKKSNVTNDEESKPKANKKITPNDEDKRKNNYIYMLDIDTNEAIRKYQNAKKAGETLDIDYSAISKVITGKSKTYANYKWVSLKNLNDDEILKFENDLKINENTEIKKYTKKIRNIHLNSNLVDKTVIQVSTDKVFVKEYTYEEFKNMIELNNFNLPSISDVLDGRRDSVYNYIWFYKEKLTNGELKQFKQNTHKIIRRKKYSTSKKQLESTDWEIVGTIVDVIDKLTEENNLSDNKIRISSLDIIKCCDGIVKYANGYFWSYKE